MIRVKNYIPNSITCLNLFSGIVGVIAAYNNEFELVLYCVLFSALFDFFDGFMARLLKAYSPMGKELDSLADMVSFGLVPGMVAYRLLFNANLGMVWFPYLGFLLTIFSALRLAKFNIDERQTTSFIGLATPANALFWSGLACSGAEYFELNPWYALLLVIFFSYLLVSPLPMFSLKLKSVKWSEHWDVYIFLIVSLLILIAMAICSVTTLVVALPIIIIWYLIWSIVVYVVKRHKG